jgi:drug/metabolite transporter (DMT)-like permease
VPTGTETAALAFLAVVLTAGMFPLWYAGVQRLTVERAGMFIGLLPVVSLAAAALLDLRPPPAVQLAGVLVVGAGLTLGLATRTTRTPAVPDTQPGDTQPHDSIAGMSIGRPGS